MTDAVSTVPISSDVDRDREAQITIITNVKRNSRIYEINNDQFRAGSTTTNFDFLLRITILKLISVGDCSLAREVGQGRTMRKSTRFSATIEC